MNLIDDEWATARETIEKLSQLTEYDEAAVLSCIEGIGHHVFVALDEKPGHWGYTAPNGNEWHWLLRRARNSAPTFFDTIKQQEIA